MMTLYQEKLPLGLLLRERSTDYGIMIKGKGVYYNYDAHA